jgi:hypothetical protein
MVRVVLVALLGAACLWEGVPAVALALTNWTPTASSCAAYEPRESSARWLRLSACGIDPLQAAYTTVGRTVTEVYLPLWTQGEAHDGATPLVLATRRPDYLALGEALLAASDATARRAALQGHPVAGLGEELRGIVRPGSSLGSSEARTVSGLAELVRPDFVIVDDEATPDLRLGAGLTLAGLLLLALALQALLMARRTRQSTPSVASADAEC